VTMNVALSREYMPTRLTCCAMCFDNWFAGAARTIVLLSDVRRPTGTDSMSRGSPARYTSRVPLRGR
jgi:hypothetical protein